MAVPKKRTSKSRKRKRKTVWAAKAQKIARKAFSQARSVLTGRSNSFYYTTNDDISK
uniref:Large ribosomal subunit protein bL32c n=1 Tax=Lycopodium clavatum TaxID=3252 RepID=A0A3Q9R2N8_LYCCL|nr:ribosomal protein L32 [Lycopodium clavatum]YP_011003816.1 ribosomal protein L32 [Lycopodium japonicum]AZU95767.1 ribosomal protein L32 [Lycopodium clavatum]WPS66387.1 ribosomal protein L32 [Lycopodium japonicum]